ncbi:hypothetical protein LTR16_000559 [Cryomyces antarcticus]|uniref:Anaphase-promoting complex subunit 4 WD40 domain-containing protein n=1 Tax=Cryomyces antarcticus TaxID=329879 RepID=A0ABR0M955_9PEZI|nr:hypothetical protein LTR16_000559 [Cryomyces antarcticus]
METSQLCTSLCHAAPSPNGVYIASLTASRFLIRKTTTHDILRSWPLPSEHNTRNILLRWSADSTRVVLADSDNTRVYDLRDTRWLAHINNGSGGMGKIVNAEFGGTRNEVLLFSEFGARVTVWNVDSGRSVEIRDPKFTKQGRGWDYRPVSSCGSSGNSMFALLSRADGHVYRTYSGEGVEADVQGLGIKSVEWSPRGDFLAVGGCDYRVTLLSTRTFSPAVFLDHTPTIQLPNTPVYTELVSGTSRSYQLAPQPISPPTASIAAPSSVVAPSPSLAVGISLVAFNKSGTLVVTRNDTMPTTVWFWDLSTLSPHSIMIQHSPVKSLLWHPTRVDLLLIQCVGDETILYLYNAASQVEATPPTLLNVPLTHSSSDGKLEAKWLSTSAESKPVLLVGNVRNWLLIYPDGKEPVLSFDRSHNGDGADQQDIGDESEDSLFNILTGRTPLPVIDRNDRNVGSQEEFDDSSERLDDTFREKKRVGVI